MTRTSKNYEQIQARRKPLIGNKQEEKSEAEKVRRKTPNIMLLDRKLKMTSPRKVNIESEHSRQKPSCDSPSVKRLKPYNFAKILPGTSPNRNKSGNSPFNFKKLLTNWEDLSNRNMTSAVIMTPK